MRRRMTIPILVLSMLATVLFPVIAMAANLSWGSQGTEVVQVQQALNKWGYWAGPEDGVFGQLTYQAVIQLQKDNSLSADGIVGPATRQVLGLSSSTPSRSGSTVSRSGSSGRVLTMVSTAYDGCWSCNRPYYGYPSYIGLPLKRGIAAVDPRVIPMGARLYVEGYGNAIAADQGNAIKGNRIDLFFDTHQQALNYGMKKVKVTILN